MIGRNEELNNYVLKAQGISRTALNVMAGIGLFIFGWLLVIVFSNLGKGNLGWAYVIPIIVILAGVSVFEPMLGLLAPLIYIVAWIHANRILSRYESAARQRITEIEYQGETGIDTVMEKGLLLGKVLQDKRSSVDVLAGALRLSGGDPVLFNLTGITMSANKRYKEAAEFYDRALASTEDSALIKQIKGNRRSIEKKIT